MRPPDATCRSVRLAAHRGQQSREVLATRAARAQVRRDAWVPLLRRGARRHQLGVDVQHLHRLGASHVTRIGPQEAVEFGPAIHELLEESSPIYPLAARAARSLRRASNSVL